MVKREPKLKVLLTGTGCPGAATLIRTLTMNNVEVHGTDAKKDVVGRWLCKTFHQVPPADHPDFTAAMTAVARRLDVDAILPEAEYELIELARHRNEYPCPILVSKMPALYTALNKVWLHQALSMNNNTYLYVPDWEVAETYQELTDAIEKRLCRGEPAVMKPERGKGSRGVRIVDPNLDPYKHLIESKPDNIRITPRGYYALFPRLRGFTTLGRRWLVTDYVEGPQLTVDAVVRDGEILISTVKTVEETRWGVVTISRIVRRPRLEKAAQDILDAIPLDHCVNLQFIAPPGKEPKLIEINPRVSSYVHHPNLSLPYIALLLATGHKVDLEAERAKAKRLYGRLAVRYMDQVFEGGDLPEEPT